MLIGLHGKARSGKDTTYEFIAEWAQAQRRPARRDAFADRLKLSAARALGYHHDLAECVAFCNRLKDDVVIGLVAHDQWLPYHTVTGREFLQYYGTEAHREVFGADFWVSAVLDGYDPGELLVVTDIRFPNEAEAIRAHGEVWHVVRGNDRIAEKDHASEKPLPAELIDRTILNNQDLDHLHGLVQTAMEELT